MGLFLSNLDTVEKLVGLAVTILSLLGFNEYARRAETLERFSALTVYLLRAACIGAVFGLLFALTVAQGTFWANVMASVALVTLLMSGLAWLIAALFAVENGGWWTGGLGGAVLWLIFKFIERAALNNWVELAGFVILGAITGLLLQWVDAPPRIPTVKAIWGRLRHALRRRPARTRTRSSR